MTARWETITCCNCGSSNGPFSKRQMKLWKEAKCTPCILQEDRMMDGTTGANNNGFKTKTKQGVNNDGHEGDGDDDDDDDEDEEHRSTKRRKINQSDGDDNGENDDNKEDEDKDDDDKDAEGDDHDDDGEEDHDDDKDVKDSQKCDDTNPETQLHADATTQQAPEISTTTEEATIPNQAGPSSTNEVVVNFDNGDDLCKDAAAAASSKNTKTRNNDPPIIDQQHVVSINAMKRKIMRRELETNEKMEDDYDYHDSKLSLLQELSCVICHELLYDPISLPNCGHSFCSNCWAWWEAKSFSIVSCPTCRTIVTTIRKNNEDEDDSSPETTTWKPTRALQVAIAALFPDATADRELSVVAGENEGQHSMGNAVILPIQEHDWQLVFSGAFKIRHSIILDETDQCMVYGLAVQDISWEEGTTTVHISVCHLRMEQDEAEEGFPVQIIDGGDDECLIVSPDETMIAIFDSNGPVARQSISSGFIELRDMHLSTKCYSIRHESTGCELQIQATGNGTISAAETTNSNSHKARRSGVRSLIDEGYCSSDDDEEAEAAAMEQEADEDDNDFLVEDDMCQICHDGGELLVCDGGGRAGCARSYHLACIGRPGIPAGDWICQDCAAENGIITGIEGHEYPEDSDADVEVFAEFSGDDDDDHDDDSHIDGPNPSVAAASRTKNKRIVLMDSSDEQESDS